MVLCTLHFAYLIQDFKNFSTLLFDICLIEIILQSQMSPFSRNWKHHWKCREQKGNFQTALVITFWNFKKFWYRFEQPQAKRNSISSTQYNKLGAVVASQLAKLLRILGNQEMLKVSQIYVDPQPSAPSSFKKLDLGDRYQTFLALSSFIGFLYFVLNIFSRIV